jgi:hypothetical protein
LLCDLRRQTRSQGSARDDSDGLAPSARRHHVSLSDLDKVDSDDKLEVEVRVDLVVDIDKIDSDGLASAVGAAPSRFFLIPPILSATDGDAAP